MDYFLQVEAVMSKTIVDIPIIDFLKMSLTGIECAYYKFTLLEVYHSTVVQYGKFREVQWLALAAFTAMAYVQTLTGELRFHKLHGVAKKKKKFFYSIQNHGTITSNSLPPYVPCCGYMSSFLVGINQE